MKCGKDNCFNGVILSSTASFHRHAETLTANSIAKATKSKKGAKYSLSSTSQHCATGSPYLTSCLLARLWEEHANL